MAISKTKTTTRRKTTTTKATAKAKPVKRYKFTKVEKTRSKADVFTNLAENTGMGKKEITEVFDCLSAMIRNDLKKNNPRVFTIPGLSKIEVKRKPARKARKGTNPFTGEECMFKAKPACNVVKVRPLKGLKDMV